MGTQSTRLITCVALVLVAETAMANPWIELVERIGKEKICNLAGVPGGTANPKPTNTDERFRLYLRCEAKGGRDEFVKDSCCEHVKPGENNVCPDSDPNVIVPIREAFRAAVKC